MNKKILFSAVAGLCVAAWAGTLNKAANNDNGFIIPFTIKPTSSDAKKIVVLDNNSNGEGDGVTWECIPNDTYINLTTSAIRYEYNTYQDADDWFFIPVASNDAESTYNLEFEYRVKGSYCPENLTVCYGNDTVPAAMTHELWRGENLKNETFETVTVDITSSRSEFKYIGFHACSTKNQFGIYVRNISLSEANPYIPSAASILSSEINGLEYTANVILPAKTVAGADITNTVGLEVSVDGKIVDKIDNRQPGETLIVSRTLAKGAHIISLRAFSNSDNGIQYSDPVSETVTAVRTDAYSLPFEFALSNEEFSSECTIINSNNDDRTWVWNETKKCPAYPYSSDKAADDWIILPVVDFGSTPGTFEFSIEAAAESYNSPESFEVCVGDAPTAAGMTPVITVAEITNSVFKEFTGKTALTTGGIKYIGIHASSQADRYNLYVKNLKVNRSADLTPGAPEIAAADINGLDAIFKILVPSTSADGLEYTENLTLRTEIDGNLHSSCSAAPGQQVEVPVSFAIGSHRVAFSLIYGEGETALHGEAATYELMAKYPDGYAYPLPFVMMPTPGEFETFTIVSDKTDNEYTWSYNADGECMQCRTESNSSSDEWIFLPMFKVEDANRIYKVSVDVRGTNASYPESFDICIGTEATAAVMTAVISRNDIGGEYDFEEVSGEWMAPASGNYMIGIHCRTSADYTSTALRLRNIKVADSGRTGMVPGAVTNVAATPDATGALKATVTFTMPTLSKDGSLLPTDSQITATVKFDGGKPQSVTGTPGSKHQVTLNGPEGKRDIIVTTSSEAGEGESIVIPVYCGLDIPSRPVVAVTESEDNMILNVTWDDAEAGENGGAVNKAALTHVICTRAEGSLYWNEIAEIPAGERNYTYSADARQRVTYIGVKAVNAKGKSQEGFSYAVTGKAYELPLSDNFRNGEPGVNPVITSAPHAQFIEDWEYDYPARIFPDKLTNQDGKALICERKENIDGNIGRLTLPKFTTVDACSAKVTITYYDSPLAPKAAVYLIGYGHQQVKLGEITPDKEYGWKDAEFDLSSDMYDKNWVYLNIEPEFEAAPQAFVMRGYSVKNNYANDLKISVTIPEEFNVGKATIFNVNIDNQSVAALSQPEVECKIEGKSFSSILTGRIYGTGEIAPGATGTIAYRFVPLTEMLGDCKITARFLNHSDDVESNNIVEKSSVITEGNSLVIPTLTATVVDGMVELAWTEPTNEKCFDTAEGYHIYRNDIKIAERHPETSYLDTSASHGNWYHVAAVTSDDEEHPLSNKVVVDFLSSAADIDMMKMVYAVSGGIRILGFEGEEVGVVTLDGKKVVSRESISGNEDISLESGIYIINIGRNAFKIKVE